MIGIIGAMASEVDGLKAAMQDKKIKTKASITFCEGILFSQKAVVAQSGIGKVNAALCTQNMINEYAPELIINTGCAAGVGKDVHIGDIVLAKSAVQHDLDYGNLGDQRGFINGINLINIPADMENTEKIAKIAESMGINTKIGVVATGDQFLCESAKKKDICDTFGADAVEMEGGAIAHAAYMNGTPFVILRSVSDSGDEEAPESFEKFVEKVNKINIAILEKFLKGQK